MEFLAHIFICLVIFVGIDMLWIAGIAKQFYREQLHRFLADTPNYVAAFVFYVIYSWGILYFALEPGLRNNDLPYLVKHAAMLGFVAYATYDLTNLATLKKWPPKLVVADIIWGTILTTAVAVAGYGIFPAAA